MKKIKKSEILSAKTSTGKTKYWRAIIYQDIKKYYLGSEHWIGEGKHTELEPKEIIPKNLGKKNATTPKIQAELEFERKIISKKEEGYTLEGETTTVLPLPMLAHSFDKRSHDIVWPAYVQPKYDGCRCLYNSKIGAYSREGKFFIKEIFQHLEFDTKGYTLDGELMLLDQDFQDSMKAIKKYSDLSKKLCYVVYDILIEDIDFDERLKILLELSLEDLPLQIRFAPTYEIKNEEKLKEMHNAFVSSGFEGAIIRNKKGLYKIGHRSKDLQKYKDFIDKEFEIIGAKEGAGVHKGCICWRCKTEKGEEFDANPDGELEARKALYKVYLKDPGEFIGKKLTVKYQSLTQRGVPRFPVAKIIRDYE